MTDHKTAQVHALGSDEDVVTRFCAALQPLPSVFRYYDELPTRRGRFVLRPT